MKTNRIILYDSQYGNTHKIAKAIAESISAKLINVSDAKNDDLKDIGLLVIGSPTQGGRATPTLQEFLNGIPKEILKNTKVAVFDTRFLESNLNFALKMLVKTIGYAAPKMAAVLESKGGKLILPPEGFIVKSTKGPLAEGELERSRKWLTSIKY